MDVVYEVCAFFVIVFGLLAGACFSMNHRDAALWLTCLAIVGAVIGGFSYWQDRLWETDAVSLESSAGNPAPDPDRPWIVIADAKLQPLKESEPATVSFTLRNAGRTPGRIKSATIRFFYKLPAEPIEKVPKYQEITADIPESGTLMPHGLSTPMEVRSPQVLTQPHVFAISLGGMQLVVMIKYTYVDLAGTTHTSQFGLLYDHKRNVLAQFDPLTEMD